MKLDRLCDLEVAGSIFGWVIPKTLKIVLAALYTVAIQSMPKGYIVLIGSVCPSVCPSFRLNVHSSICDSVH